VTKETRSTSSIRVSAQTASLSKQSQPSTLERPSKSAATQIIGSKKTQVDELLRGWTCRQSNRSTVSRPIYYFTKDVSVIVYFRNARATGVDVIDRPGAGVTSISEHRFATLVKLIGEEPKSSAIKQDSNGIREFSVGDTQ